MLNGGLGDSIAQFLSTTLPTPIEMIGVDDTFGESGTPKVNDKIWIKFKKYY